MIADARPAAERLKESEARYRDLIEHSLDMIQSVDPEGRLLSVIPAIKARVAQVRGDAVRRAVEPPLDALEGGAERRLPARYDALFSPAEAAS